MSTYCLDALEWCNDSASPLFTTNDVSHKSQNVNLANLPYALPLHRLGLMNTPSPSTPRISPLLSTDILMGPMLVAGASHPRRASCTCASLHRQDKTMQACDTLHHNLLDVTSLCDTFGHGMRENVIHVRLDGEEFERAARLAARTKISVGALIRDLLREADERGSGNSEVRAERAVPVARRSTSAPGRSAESSTVASCKHGADPKLCRFEECRRK